MIIVILVRTYYLSKKEGTGIAEPLFRLIVPLIQNLHAKTILLAMIHWSFRKVRISGYLFLPLANILPLAYNIPLSLPYVRQLYDSVSIIAVNLKIKILK
jgi:hypothetical protein